jgi:hypothetical protein
VAGVCANEEVAIAVANRIVINDVKVFMAACCQLSVLGDKCDQIYLVTDLNFSWRSKAGRAGKKVNTAVA